MQTKEVNMIVLVMICQTLVALVVVKDSQALKTFLANLEIFWWFWVWFFWKRRTFSRKAGPPRGQDLQIKVALSYKEILEGVTKKYVSNAMPLVLIVMVKAGLM